MDQSRRAVESYRRSKMIDGVTSDEDKVTPVYKLEEICDFLRSAHVSIVKEVAEFILKRLQHKSPIVKQKALRVIKYAVGKSGVEFRREMQRNSVDIRQLMHYKGQPDPLKGDALNKAVRETAQETLSTLFSSDESKSTPVESSLGSRIQGFGSTNYEMPSEDKKSFISEVVDIGTATIKQRLNSFIQSPSMRKNDDTGTYRSPNLRRSFTSENDYSNQYEGIGSHGTNDSSSRFSKNAGSGNWSQDISSSLGETSNGDSAATYSQKTREEKLIETIVTAGGVRLQPTRDALHVFLLEASKLNPLALGQAIEAKLKSPMWQVRMKAICVLEAVLRKRDEQNFSVMASYFSENYDVVEKCSESPQASLREKANKVMSLLDHGQVGVINHSENTVKHPQTSAMVDLIDTGDQDILGMEDTAKTVNAPRMNQPSASIMPLVGDLLGDSFGGDVSSIGTKLDDDPFGDVSFHTNQDKNHITDLFSGMAGDNSGNTGVSIASQKTESDPFDLFSSSSESYQEHGNHRKDVNDLMDDLSIRAGNPLAEQNGSVSVKGSEDRGSISTTYPENRIPNDILNTEFAPPAGRMNTNPMFPIGAMAYNIPPGVMFNPLVASNPMNYNAMGSLIAQQQFLATMSNFQQLGNLHSNTSFNAVGSQVGHTSPLPDIFNPGISNQPPTSLMSDSKREENKAFDFVSDHLSAAREQKRLI
ncbi:VHS domain-containing protein [Dorcoceras hygrometricum]|uniref:VHS domain-containing protein n=1 Tax=Dorcoceras hygrometricum TaxID=472368 RepID=A0A2Z7C228_9LAMI|nr:VHS domain-containing protein [Dorcoceras hygrometricum]